MNSSNDSAMRTFILLLCCFLSSWLYAQTQQSLIGQWEASASEFGAFYTYNWMIKNNWQCMVRTTAGNRYTDKTYTWEYTAPFITLKTENKTVFKGEVKWQGKDQFTLVVIDDGNPEHKGLKRNYFRQKEQTLARDNGGQMPTQMSAPGSTCYACYGTGKADCSSCAGAGGYYDRVSYQRYNATTGYYDTEYRDEWRHCTTMGCQGGKVECAACNRRSSQGSGAYAPVPTPEGLAGRWRSGATIYHFQAQTGAEGRYLTLQEGNYKQYGLWVIEDGFLKIRLFLGGNSPWKKYRFVSFDFNNLRLSENGGYAQLLLQRLKE